MKRKIGIPIALIIVFALAFFLFKVVRTSVFGEQKESYTFVGTVKATTYSTMPNVPLVEIYHDGPSVALAKIEKVEDGVSPYAIGSEIVLVIKDYSVFPGLESSGKKYRVKLTRFVERDGFEYWRCTAIEI